jgi:hypothetical protein
MSGREGTRTRKYARHSLAPSAPYIPAMSQDPKDERRKRGLRTWADLLARHVGTLRKPYATGRPIHVDEDGDGDEQPDDVRPTVQ